MKRLLPVFLALSFFAACALWALPASADASHARIVRLSLVQGDVRYSQQFHKDSLDDSKAVWERAPLNLPLREGFALATDEGARAEVEFENGAMAFLAPNTAIEFYDLSLNDGFLITRLVLRQGSAIFYVHPAKGDFFSVTGGDFSVEATDRTRFRVDNYDDGSTVNVEQGQIAVLRKNETKPLHQGQSYSININDGQSASTGRSPDADDFDKWVSGRIDSVVTATTYSQQYVNSPTYDSGFADLYNYGNWYNVAGYGYGWQPYGAGLGWNPFAFGSWGYDPFLGWNFIGSAPWGWLPYHYGGWIFAPGMGWMWMPTGFGGGYGYGNGYGYNYGPPVVFRPVTGVWVHSNGVNGVVPMNPGDKNGKPPLNLAQGVYTVHGNTLATTPASSAFGGWSVMSHPPRNVFTASTIETAPAPTKVSRTILAGRAVTLSRDSSIAYDPTQHRFVNSSDPAKVPAEATKNGQKAETSGTQATNAGVNARNSAKPSVPSATRTSLPPRPSIAPPTPPATVHSAGRSGGGMWGEPASAAPAGSTASTHSSSAGTSHASGGHH
jgi:FecR protein